MLAITTALISFYLIKKMGKPSWLKLPDGVQWPQPPKLCELIMRTVHRVRKVGQQLEILLKVRLMDHASFSFLIEDDPNHSFYECLKLLPENEFWSLLLNKTDVLTAVENESSGAFALQCFDQYGSDSDEERNEKTEISTSSEQSHGMTNSDDMNINGDLHKLLKMGERLRRAQALTGHFQSLLKREQAVHNDSPCDSNSGSNGGGEQQEGIRSRRSKRRFQSPSSSSSASSSSKKSSKRRTSGFQSDFESICNRAKEFQCLNGSSIFSSSLKLAALF